MTRDWSLAELAEASEIPARTIRFYIARGLLDGPVKAGRGAVYTHEHLERLGKIKALQAQGRMLSEIGPMLTIGPPAAAQPAPAVWHHYAIAEDVVLCTRADVSPWRMKQIRAAIGDLAARLKTEAEGEKS